MECAQWGNEAELKSRRTQLNIRRMRMRHRQGRSRKCWLELVEAVNEHLSKTTDSRMLMAPLGKLYLAMQVPCSSDKDDVWRSQSGWFSRNQHWEGPEQGWMHQESEKRDQAIGKRDPVNANGSRGCLHMGIWKEGLAKQLKHRLWPAQDSDRQELKLKGDTD